MKRLRKIFAAVAVIALLLFAQPADAGLRLVIGMRIPPPPPRPEIVQARPRLGAISVRGHWLWSPVVGRHIWVPGMWVERHTGFVWVDGRSTYTRRGCVIIDGYWKRVRR